LVRRPLRFLSGVLLATLLAACGGGPTAQPDATDRPTASVAGPRDWQLVWFSDSGAWGVASDWAKRIEQVAGVHVDVYDYIDYGSGSADKVLGRLRSDTALRKQVAGAEVIVLYASNYDVPLDVQKACLSMTSTKPPRPLTAAMLQPYRDKLTAIYDEVFALRRGRPTIVRALDLYVPVVAKWRSAGVYDACSAGWLASAKVNAEVAAAHGVPVASLYDVFNGPRHDRDPVKRGLIAPDGLHTTDKAQALILRALDALGYEPITP
jgi:hypothetical protein